MAAINSISLTNVKPREPQAFKNRVLQTSDRSNRMITDTEIMAGCMRGERLSQRALYDRYADRLFSVAIRYVKHIETAEDVLAEAWLKIFTKLDTFNAEGSFEGWMKRIVSNEALMHLRKGKLDLAELSEVVIGTEPSDVRMIDELENEDVLRLLDSLPDGCRAVFNLYEIEGYKHREIAELLGVSINTSKSQLILAKKKLREAYQQLSQREGKGLRPIPPQTPK